MPDHIVNPDRPKAADRRSRPGRATIEGGSSWRLRNWRLRNKLIVVLLVPVLIALAVAGLRGKFELDRKAVFDQAVANMNTLGDVAALMHELQQERAQVVTYVAAGRSGDRAGLQVQFGATDDALDRLDDFVEANPDSSVTSRLHTIPAARDQAIGSRYPDVALYAAYTEVLDTIVLGAPEFTAGLTDTALAERARALQAVIEAKEYLARQTAILLIAAAHDEFPSEMLDRARAAEASSDAAISIFRGNASIEDVQFYADTVTGPEVDERELFKNTAFSRADQGVPLGIDAPTLAEDGTVTVNAQRQVENGLLSAMRGVTGEAASAATRTAVRDALIVLAALLLALLVTVFVARSLLKPLRVLRRDVLDVANRRLPATVEHILADPDPVSASQHAVEPVPVFTREETGQLARSFDAVQEQAVRMATEQALLRDNINSILVNLSRRSQALVERQLSLIDRLEQDEQDPDQLASLFELDHLATRMRRNGESLLVLSGTGLSRQLNRPVPAADVVGAAISEVEHYARIQVATAPDVTVQGRAVSDLVHVIAELLDNATFFSGPEKKVIVRMAMTRRHELNIRITDQGVGMIEEEIEAANARLADPPDLDVAVTRRMGLYVVARLAKRHNIVVRLSDNEDIEGGLVARITVPADLVAPIGATAQLPVPPAASSLPSSPSLPPLAPPSSALPSALQASSGGRPRTSSLASAFTGNMPRLRDDGRPVTEEPLFGSPLPEPSQPPPPPPEPAPEPSLNADAPTERLPIYEAVLSQWFEAADTGSTPRHAADTPAPDSPSNGNGAHASPPQDAPAAPEADPSPWTSPGDDGWLAAQALLDDSAPESLTNAGLPKRVPKARLVPGSAAPRHEARPAPTTDETAEPEAPVRPPRSAEAVRGRLSSFQQGVRRGRHALIETYAGDQSDQSLHDEEHE